MGRLFSNLIMAMLMATVLLGCYRNRPAAQISKPYQPPPEPANQLEEVLVADRSAIQVTDIGLAAAGTPVNPDAQDSLRRLSLEQSASLARQHSRTANALQAEYHRLSCKENVPECILQMIQLSAAHHRNESAGQAIEAYLNLVEVYLQHDLLLQSAELIEETERTINQLRAADVVVDFDRRELDRRRMLAEEHAFALLEKQQTLTTGLELALQLRRTSKSPIWTDYQAPQVSLQEPPELNSALTIAWENRRDLQALKTLASCCSADLLESIRAQARSIHPLLGLAFSPHRMFFRALFQPEEDLAEANDLQSQLTGVIEAQKDMIELEVAKRVNSINKRISLIQLKQARILSLRDSIQAAKDAAIVKPVDLESQLDKEAKILEIQSELISERIGLEIDRAKLMQAQGTLN